MIGAVWQTGRLANWTRIASIDSHLAKVASVHYPHAPKSPSLIWPVAGSMPADVPVHPHRFCQSADHGRCRRQSRHETRRDGGITRAVSQRRCACAAHTGLQHFERARYFRLRSLRASWRAKRTHELIPFCHPLGLENCKVPIDMDGDEAVITCTASVQGKTGVEMEALDRREHCGA